MSSSRGTYKHLDAIEPLEVSFTMADLAARVDQLNYGTHRMLSELVLLRRARYEKSRYRGDKEMADALEAILNRGLF